MLVSFASVVGSNMDTKKTKFEKYETTEKSVCELIVAMEFLQDTKNDIVSSYLKYCRSRNFREQNKM